MSAERAPMVSIRNVVKRYGALTVVDHVDLEVARGERVVVCGPSGSGKSTLISCINGLVRHDEGQIIVDGIEVSHAAGTLPEVRARVGMVFQQFNLFPHLSALENCMLAPRTLRGLTRAQARERAMAKLERMRIPEQAHKRPEHLSGGQQQRVAIARALTLEPELMLFDEPTSALDPEMIKEVLDAMIDLARSGMSMIVVTHEMGFARHAADRVVYMEQGRIVEQARPDDFFNRPADERSRAFLSRILAR
jgi:ABC-type polar amino acid transport system ATPase subunit